MPEVTDEDLDRIAEDERAQELLAQAARKKAEFWDALSDLERYVGLEFDSDVTPLAVDVGRAPTYDTDFDADMLKERLKEGFEHKAVVDETGIVFNSEN
jgi:transglutaminase-like putative cysteine protease